MIQFGSKVITDVYYGGNKIKEVYKGNTLVYSSGPIVNDSSMVIKEEDHTVVWEFHQRNTPLSDLSTGGDHTTSITVNGRVIPKNEIYQITFGDSYSNVTTMPQGFGRSFSLLTTLDLTALSSLHTLANDILINATSLQTIVFRENNNITNIGQNFLRACMFLEVVDMSQLVNVTHIGNNFMYQCVRLVEVDMSALTNLISLGNNFIGGASALTTFKIGTPAPPTLGSNAMNGGALELIQVPCGSEGAYKAATNWIAHETLIEGDC